jgi:hypothetical protein
MNSPKALARSAGALYLLFAVLGVFAHLVVRSGIRVPGDAAATAGNIVANSALFRFSLVADIAMATLFVFLGIVLYRLLNHVDRHVATAMVVFVSVGAGMILVNLVFHYAALSVATDAPDPSALGSGSTDALALLLVDMHHSGYAIAGVFFGLWLLPLGYLAYRSGMFPRALGVLLMIAGVSWIIHTLVKFLVPNLGEIFQIILTAPTLAEFGLLLYLLIKGVRVPRQADPVKRNGNHVPAASTS